ncbi:MAG: N-6 DNA methylase [Imperialibacter sp.]|uniref:type I restriction-modification system subunit M n=1 Tax=Imperialibacter sp. TaxID=2038411 RepID=UPI0032ED148A
MTNEQLKELEDKLWDSANSLRAYGGIKAADYAVPVLGLIFLKFADNKYSDYEPQILDEYVKGKGSRMERSIEEIALAACGFYLPEHARFKHLLNLPGKVSMAKALDEAMSDIEKYQDAKFQGVLPTAAYYEIEKKRADILPQLLKTFSDIPQDASGDVFGKIYEYFLGKFAHSEGQKGGEFFTPTSVVRFIVEVIEPYSGKLYDPACGSGGMFVQSATFLKRTKHDLNDIYVCGQEFMGETVRLAKMNLMVNNLRGEITEVNSYEADPYDSFGKFDYVMANPPFNVKSVKEATVQNDQRFYHYGLPKNKGKKDDKITDANYLWISLFATSLNEKGRAGFVMANSASDARNSEYEIRKKIVDSGIVDCMVSMPSNMFFTVTLPATLWFFDKGKVSTDRKDKILFIDARNVYRQIDRAHREWTEEQQQNLAAIVRLYRGETERYLELIDGYLKRANNNLQEIVPRRKQLESQLETLVNGLKKNAEQAKGKLTPAKRKKLDEANFFSELANFKKAEAQRLTDTIKPLKHALDETPTENEAQLEAANFLADVLKQEQYQWEALKVDSDVLMALWKQANDDLKLKNDKDWSENGLNRAGKAIEEAIQGYTTTREETGYWLENMEWLQKRFPDAQYEDITGLCKTARREEYAKEQDYSLNAGRFVGVEDEADLVSQEEFRNRLDEAYLRFRMLSSASEEIERSISTGLENLIRYVEV